MNESDSKVLELVDQVKKLCTQVGLEGRARNILIGSLLSDRLELRTAIPVLLEYDGEQFIASSADLNLYGSGPDESAALDDFRQATEDFYFSLKGDDLGHDLKRRFDYLSSIIVEK